MGIRSGRGRERALWAGAAAAALALLLLPGAGLSPASGPLAAAGPLPALRLALALPVLALGLGVAPARWLGVGGLAGAALGITVAPLAWAAVGAAVTRGGGDFGDAGRAALSVAGALSAIAAVSVRAGAGPGETPPRGFALAVGAWTAAVALLFLINPVLPWRSDAWFHAAVTYRMDALGWPPGDPYYVGVPLGYLWAFHLALGTLAGAAGVTPFAAGAALSVTAALAVALWLGLLARDLCGRAAMAPAVGIAVLGLNPLGWVAWLARGAIGRDAGWRQLGRAWQDGALGSLNAISAGYPHPSVAFFADQFLLVTAFGLGLAAVLAFAWIAFSHQAPSGWRAGAAAGLAAAVAFFLHGGVGAALLAAGGAGLAAVWILGGGRHSLVVAAGLGLAALAALPYGAICSLSRAESAVRPGFSAGMLWTWIAAGGGVAALALAGIAGWRGTARKAGPAGGGAAARAGLLTATAVLIVFSLAAVMPGHDETKFFNLGAALLAVPAAGGWVRLRGTRAARVARRALYALCVPTAALGLAGLVAERGQDVRGHIVPPAAEAEAYEWLAVNAGARAGVIEVAGPDLAPASLDVPVHARRGLVSGDPAYARIRGYAPRPTNERAALAHMLGEGRFDPWAEALLGQLRAHGVSEFYFMSRASSARPGGGGAARPLPPPWAPVFRNASLTIYRLGEGTPRLAAGPRP